MRQIDGIVGLLIVSFSSIEPDDYRYVHAHLDQKRMMANLQAAQRLLTRTRLAISLTPMAECLPTLPQTVAWLRAQGIDTLTMSPTLYNRGGARTGHEPASAELRRLIREHHLRSQVLHSISSTGEIARQWVGNPSKCVPRNVHLFVAASGDYLYCYNDLAHPHPIGNVAADSIATTLARRQQMPPVPALCDDFNMRLRYGPAELLKAGVAFMGSRLTA